MPHQTNPADRRAMSLVKTAWLCIAVALVSFYAGTQFRSARSEPQSPPPLQQAASAAPTKAEETTTAAAAPPEEEAEPSVVSAATEEGGAGEPELTPYEYRSVPYTPPAGAAELDQVYESAGPTLRTETEEAAGAPARTRERYAAESYTRAPSPSYPEPAYTSTPAPYFPSVPPSVAENGSYYGETSETTGRPKTVHVEGYYRRDGTYVRGHYRSAPRRKN